MIRIHLLFLGLACLAGFSPLLAQSNANRIATAEFSCVVWESLGLGDIYYLEGENTYEPLKFRKGSRSAIFPLTGQQSLKLFTQKKVEEELVYELVGEGNFPSGTNQILFLVRKSAGSGKLPLQVIGIDDSTKALPAGTYKVVNFTGKWLDLRINESTDRVKPRATKLVKPEIPQKGGFLPFYIGSRDEGVIYETRLYCQRNARELIFVFPSTGNRSISVKFLSQLVGSHAESEAASAQAN